LSKISKSRFLQRHSRKVRNNLSLLIMHLRTTATPGCPWLWFNMVPTLKKCVVASKYFHKDSGPSILASWVGVYEKL
jgi:hypothetical protein